jgi:hypothetical protein
LSKLETYGIKGPLLAWIKNYLSNRKFCWRCNQWSAARLNTGTPSLYHLYCW